MSLTPDQVKKLEEHEGFRGKVYKCTAGANTIGIGLNLDANPLKLNKEELKSLMAVGITHDKAVYYLKMVCNQIEARLLKELDWYDALDSNTKYVLIDASYNMGVSGLLAFKNTLSLIKEGKFTAASDEMLRSKWAKQVPNRAKSVTDILKSGKIR
jgi:lysozyme